MNKIPHIYIDDKLVGLGSCKIAIEDLEPKYKITITHDSFVECPLPEYATMYLNHKGHWYSNHRLTELIESLKQTPKNINELVDNLNKTGKYFIIYAYIHSGISLSRSPFNDNFDSGIYGIIKIDEDSAVCKVDNIIKNLENWLNGDCYVVNVIDELDGEVDSLYNVYADSPEDIKTALEENDLRKKYGITDDKIEAAWNIR